MANSDLWRELAISFQSVPKIYECTVYRSYRMGASREFRWTLPSDQTALAHFDAMARRGASMLTPPPTGDLMLAWLEALWKEATEGPVVSGIEILGEDRVWSSDHTEGGPIELRGKIDRVFQASSTLCRNFESEALQDEFEERQRNDPKNWSLLRQRFEAFKSIRELQTGPHERIPEALVRDAIADQLGIKPEEVTWKQIQFEVAGMTRDYPAIALVPTELAPSQQSPKIEQTANVHPEPKALRDSYFANFPDEKIKLRDLCWAAGQHYREWKRWLAGKLKDGSTPDLAFRRILLSGKRPSEFNKKPRPHGWE